MFSALGSSI
jgi:hypothetical protein